MAQIALPRQQVTQSAGVGSPLYERRRNSNVGPIEMIPNPEFKFPMRDPDDATPSDSASSPAATSTSRARPMSLQAYPTGRRGSAHGPRQKSVNALPEFSFNPAGNTSTSIVEQSVTSTVPSPPNSPLATPTTPRPIGGHRRGGSEFIGGDSRSAGVSLLSSSPTKGDGVLPQPNATLRPGPPGGRRGHAHRRSGAISSHDLSSIMNPPTSPRAGSAPVTPSEGNEFKFGHSVNKSMSQPSLRDHNSYADDSDSSQRPPSRARVGFSDKVEYIRPLSTISSETETSMSTIRGHSATNSLSSVISANAPSPQATRVSRSPMLSTVEDERRPSTAGAIMDKFKSDSLMGEPHSRKRPSSAVSPTSPSAVPGPASPTVVPPKRRGFFRLESKASYHSGPFLHTSASDPTLAVPHDSPLPSPAIDSEEFAEDSEKKSSGSRKANRKPRKVKSWANSIIPRKAKHSKKKAKKTSPPPEEDADHDDTDVSEDLDFDPNFDDDNTVTIVSPTSSEAKSEGDISSWRPRELKRVDSDSCVIDLDAALGPFNTPQGAGPRGQQRGFAAHRRAMHSSGGVLPMHRRTESAPELVPFEFRTSTVATPSPMADVFEEEEPEEDVSAAKKQNKAPASVSEDAEEIEEPKIQLVEADGAQNSSVHALACCLKAVASSDGATGIEQLRLACGGHGYMDASNLPATYGLVTATCTYEGENTVLLLQTARYLVKAWRQAIGGELLPPTVGYLAVLSRGVKQRPWKNTLSCIVQAHQAVAAGKIRLATENMDRRIRSGVSPEDAWNQTSIELAHCAESHCRTFLVMRFVENIRGLTSVSKQLHEVLMQLCELYSIYWVLQRLGDFLRFSCLNNEDVPALQARFEEILAAIRPNAVGIVDGFDIRDEILASALGAYDGNVYQRLFDEAMKSPLNQESVNQSFHKYLRPFLKSNL